MKTYPDDPFDACWIARWRYTRQQGRLASRCDDYYLSHSWFSIHGGLQSILKLAQSGTLKTCDAVRPMTLDWALIIDSLFF